MRIPTVRSVAVTTRRGAAIQKLRHAQWLRCRSQTGHSTSTRRGLMKPTIAMASETARQKNRPTQKPRERNRGRQLKSLATWVSTSPPQTMHTGGMFDALVRFSGMRTRAMLRQQLVYHVPVHVGQAEVAAGVAEG